MLRGARVGQFAIGVVVAVLLAVWFGRALRLRNDDLQMTFGAPRLVLSAEPAASTLGSFSKNIVAR
jgi:hypothetical protein